METNARVCKTRMNARAPTTRTSASTGTTTDTFWSVPIANAAVKQNTNNPIAYANARHTMGSSRNRASRMLKAPDTHCTTTNSSE